MHNSRFPKQGFDSGSKELTRDGKSEKQTEAKLNMRRRARLISDSLFFCTREIFIVSSLTERIHINGVRINCRKVLGFVELFASRCFLASERSEN